MTVPGQSMHCMPLMPPHERGACCAGEMKLADFGLARVFGSPEAGRYTDQVQIPPAGRAPLTAYVSMPN